MPCWTVTTIEIDLSKANPEVLVNTLTSLGLEIVSKKTGEIIAKRGLTTVTWTAGQSCKVSSNNSTFASKIQKTYAAKAVEYITKRNNWTLKKISEDKYVVLKR